MNLVVFHLIYRQWVPLVSTTPLTVLYWLFWNFACVFFIVWGCACGLGIIVLSLLPHSELSHISPSVYRQWVPLLSATPLTVLYRSFWNFSYVSSWYEGVHVVSVQLLSYFLSLFPHCELSHFSPFIYKQLPLLSATPLTVLYWLLWNFACIFFMVWGCAYGLDVIIKLFFFTFFHIVNFFHPQYIDSGYLVSTTPHTILY